jgi:hypothetical protein
VAAAAAAAESISVGNSMNKNHREEREFSKVMVGAVGGWD